MFDVGFWELCLIGVVALIVIGPERLPRAARVAGLWIGRAKRAVSSVQNEVKRELYLEDLKRLTQMNDLKRTSQDDAARLTELVNQTWSNLPQAASALNEPEQRAVAPPEDTPATERPKPDVGPDPATR